jgi:hypothetical protein
VALPHCEREGVKLADTQGEAVKLDDWDALLDCEREDVKLAVPHVEPLRLAAAEEEVEGDTEGVCVPLRLLHAEAVSDVVVHALCVALPHCERDGVKLEVCVALPHWEREGVKLVEAHAEPLRLAVTEEEADGVNEEWIDTLLLGAAEALPDAVAHTLRVALPHWEREGV